MYKCSNLHISSKFTTSNLCLILDIGTSIGIYTQFGNKISSPCIDRIILSSQFKNPMKIFFLRRKLLRALHLFVHLNLSISLLLGYLTFISGIETATGSIVSICKLQHG